MSACQNSQLATKIATYIFQEPSTGRERVTGAVSLVKMWPMTFNLRLIAMGQTLKCAR